MEQELKKQLVAHLRGGQAFKPVDELLKEIGFNELGTRPGKLPYSFYEVFYHIWFTQRDILDYCTRQSYKTPNWPEDYWPPKAAPKTPEDWEKLKATYFEDRQLLENLILSPEKGLLEKVSGGGEHILFREFLLVIEHSAYHTGQLLIILRQLGLYKS